MSEKIKAGDKAPSFTLPATGGKEVSLAQFAGKKVVLYFYPKDNTSGCTKQAQGFRDMIEAFRAKNAEVVGVSKDSIKSNYPLPSYNYKVNIGGETIAFSEVSGLNIGYEEITYKQSRVDGSIGPEIMQMPGQATAASLSLSKGYVRGSNIKVFYEWINSIQLNQVEKKDITISLCDETGAPVVTWTVMDCFPTSLDAPSFSADSNEVAIESLQLTALSVSVSEQ